MNVKMLLFSDVRKKLQLTLKFGATLSLPLLALLSLLLIISNPIKADELSMEDRIVENLSALFLFVSSMILAVSSYQLIRKEEFTTAIFAALLALLFFVIGMEEISWMQRVLNIETSEVFLQLNEQEEINLHNIFTNTAEKIYYAGAFVLLTAAPFLYKYLKKTPLSKIDILLPRPWMVVPFAVISGFVTMHTATHWAYVSIYTLTFIILSLAMLDYWKSRSISNIVGLLFVIVLIIFSIYTLASLDYTGLELRTWFGSEYRELLIATGILLYSMDRYHKIQYAPAADNIGQ